MPLRWIFLASLFALFPLSAFADVSAIGPQAYVPGPVPKNAIWVSPAGSDLRGNGTEAKPFYTPARASEAGRIVVLAPGRYPQFGNVTHGGTPSEPLVIRAASGTVMFALQDGNVPAELSASHIRLEGLEIQNQELAQPGTCLRIGADVEDIEIISSKIHHCAKGIETDGHLWLHGTLQDVTISDIQQIGFDCSGACIHQRWNRVLLQHIGDTTTSGTALTFSDPSRDLRFRDVVVRDTIGNGAVFSGGKPSLANAAFNQISGVSLRLKNGGYIGHTQIETENNGLVAAIGNNLVVEKSLFYAQKSTAIPFAIAEDDQSSEASTLLLNWNRIDIPTGQLTLAGPQSLHRVVWSGMVFWFRDGSDVIKLSSGGSLTQDQAAHSPAIKHDEDSLLYTTGPIEGDLFSAVFSGGETTRNSDGSRTITEGTQIRGNDQEPPYVLGQEQHVHLLTNSDRIARWYPYPSEITTIGNKAFGSLLRGADVTEPPGSLIKARSRAQVYLVIAPNKIRWITSEELAKAFAGPRWNQKILEFSDAELTHYQEDTPITTEEDFEDDDVLRQIADPADLFDE